MAINDWLLSLSGGAWDQPKPFEILLKKDLIRKRIKQRLSSMLQSPRLLQFLGWKRYLEYRLLENLDFSWGWKDPRNTITLPIWLEYFQKAKVIYIYRHGVDVAASLQRREQKILTIPFTARRYLKDTIWTLPITRLGYDSSPQCYELEGAFSLWEKYMQTYLKMHRQYPKNWFEIKYEDFLTEPAKLLKKLLSFVEQPCQPLKFKEIVNSINSNRCFYYKSDKKLYDFALTVKDKLEAFGYSV